MVIKKLFQSPQLPLHNVLETVDGKYMAFNIAPFRNITEEDLSPLLYYQKRSDEEELPAYVYSLYGLEKPKEQSMGKMEAYFQETKNGNSLILTDGVTAKIFEGATTRFYEGVDISSFGAGTQLRYKFASLHYAGELKNFGDIVCKNEKDFASIEKSLKDMELVYADGKDHPEIRKNWEAQDPEDRSGAIPVSPYGGYKEAKDAGELETWKVSHNATQDCAWEFGKEFREPYDMGACEDLARDFMRGWVSRHGMKRCKIVLASAIQLEVWDGENYGYCYYPSVKEEAAKIHIPGADSSDEYKDSRWYYRVHNHPVMVNAAFCFLLSIEKEITQEDIKKEEISPNTLNDTTRCPISEYASYSEAKAGGENEFRLWEKHCYATKLCAKEFSRDLSNWQRIKHVLIPQMAYLYGIERCKIVLASTIQLGSEFDRDMYSRAVVEEAARVKIPGASKSLGQDARWDYYLPDNPVAIPEAFQKICEMEKKMGKKAEKDMEPVAQNKDKTPKREVLGPVL